MIELDHDFNELRPRICVVGVGGAGGNAVANMIRSGVKGVSFVVANTDAQALQASPASRILQLGRETTEGLGAGSSAKLGRAAAEESLGEIGKMLEGSHMCFIAAGLGGGTGTGAAPVIARAARDRGILTVGVVTKPFSFEGRRRAEAAELGLLELQKHVDTLIVIPNQNLFRITSPATTFKDAFDLADQVLQQGVRGITDLMVMPGLINLDFADIRTIMANVGNAILGAGEATGDNRALRAAELAVANPLLDEAVKGARGLIISISGGEDLLLMEVDEVANHIKELADPEADIIWGSVFDPELAGTIRVSLVATGIDPVVIAPVVVPVVAAAKSAPVRIVSAPCAPLFGPLPPPLFAAAPAAVGRLPVAAEWVPDPSVAAAAEDELLPIVERVLVLTPPEGATEFAMVEPFGGEMAAIESATMTQASSAIRGASLFERMSMLARGAVQEFRDTEIRPAMPQLYRGREFAEQRIARAA